MVGRLLLGPADQWAVRSFTSGSVIVAGFALPPVPWLIESTVCEGVIDSADSMADALEAAVRGADLLVTVDDSYLDAFSDDAARAGVTFWLPQPSGVLPEWAPLLDALALGASISSAARQCNLSVRSAYRRLDEARAAMGASTTTAAVTAWVKRRQAPRST